MYTVALGSIRQLTNIQADSVAIVFCVGVLFAGVQVAIGAVTRYGDHV